MPANDPTSPRALFDCPNCHSTVYGTSADAGRSVACPRCGTYTVAHRDDTGDVPLLDDGSYAQSQQPDAAPEVAPAQVTCPGCRAALRATERLVGRKLRCPRCRTMMLIDRPGHAVTARPKAEARVAELPTTGRQPDGQRAVAAFESSVEYARPEPPRSVFFSGVFGFPFWRGCRPRWLVLSLVLVVVAAMLSVAVPVFGASGSPLGVAFSTLGAFLVSVAAAVIGFFWAAFCAACYLSIVDETAAGNDVIYEWPSTDWRDWLEPLVSILYLLALASAIAFGLAQLLLFWYDGAWMTTWLFALWVYPVVQLSAMETDSVLAPVSAPVLRSLFGCAPTWLAFLVLTTAMFVGGMYVLDAASGVAPVPGLALSAAYWPFFVFVYGRLLGRLGWYIVEAARADAARADDAAAFGSARR